MMILVAVLKKAMVVYPQIQKILIKKMGKTSQVNGSHGHSRGRLGGDHDQSLRNACLLHDLPQENDHALSHQESVPAQSHQGNVLARSHQRSVHIPNLPRNGVNPDLLEEGLVHRRKGLAVLDVVVRPAASRLIGEALFEVLSVDHHHHLDVEGLHHHRSLLGILLQKDHQNHHYQPKQYHWKKILNLPVQSHLYPHHRHLVQNDQKLQRKSLRNLKRNPQI